MDDLQMIGRRNMLCGLHVHIELPSAEDRVDVMTRMLPYLPLFIALSTSSPFWKSQPTGLKGYRLAAYDELPRTGVPELFRNSEEFEAYVGALVKAGVMKDSSYVWWSMRPSLKHPTLELRAPDVPTRIVLSHRHRIALWRSLARRLVYNPELNHNIDAVGRAVVVENKWRAQRYGVRGSFVGHGGAVTVADLVDQVIEDTAERRRRARLPRRIAALPHHREPGHVGRRAACGVRTDRQERKPRPRAAGGHRVARRDDGAVRITALLRQRGLHHQATGAGVDHAEPAHANNVSVCTASRARAGSSTPSGASGPISPSSNAPTSADAARPRPAPADGHPRWPSGCAPRSHRTVRADTAWRTASVSMLTGSDMTAQASLRSRSARAPNVAMAAASADNGPGAASAARFTAAISRSATLSTSAPTSSILPGK